MTVEWCLVTRRISGLDSPHKYVEMAIFRAPYLSVGPKSVIDTHITKFG